MEFKKKRFDISRLEEEMLSCERKNRKHAPEDTNDGVTFIHFAAANLPDTPRGTKVIAKIIKMHKLLLFSSHDDKENYDGLTALHSAICKGNFAFTSQMLKTFAKSRKDFQNRKLLLGSIVKSPLFEGERKRERNVLFNDALSTFYLRLYGVRPAAAT